MFLKLNYHNHFQDRSYTVLFFFSKKDKRSCKVPYLSHWLSYNVSVKSKSGQRETVCNQKKTAYCSVMESATMLGKSVWRSTAGRNGKKSLKKCDITFWSQTKIPVRSIPIRIWAMMITSRSTMKYTTIKSSAGKKRLIFYANGANGSWNNRWKQWKRSL